MHQRFCRQTRRFAADAPRRITVFSSPGDRRRGLLVYGNLRLPCALGRAGVTRLKREGDGATPAGCHRLLALHMRRDRVRMVATALPVRTIRIDDGWSDDPDSGRYNRPLRLPAAESHESLYREDALYDLVGILDWNLRERRSRRGSAIFLHAARPDLAPTQGCIALRPADLRRLLAAIQGPVAIVVA